MKKRVLFLLLCLTLAACSGRRVDPDFIASSDVRLSNRGENAFVYDDIHCQMSFNLARGEFRAFTDNLSDYYYIHMHELPSSEGQTIKADLEWTTYSTIEIRKGIAHKVVKLEGDTVWLWNGAQQLALTVVMLH